MRGKTIIKILIAILLIAIGWTLGQVLENVAPFTLDWNISLSDVLAIMIELFLACYIARLIEKGVQDQRVEKDFFISELTETQEALSELEKSCSRNYPLSLYLTVYEVEKAKKNLMRIWGIMAIRNRKFHSKYDKEYQKLVLLVKTLNSQLTDSNYFSQLSGVNPVKITKGLIHLNHTVAPEISKAFNSIKDNIFNWKIKINDM